MENIKKVPMLRFPEFSGEWEVKKLAELAENGFSNGVFNDPNKVGSGYKLINVSDMYIESTIDDTKLTLVELSKKEFDNNKAKYGDIFFTRSSLVKDGIAYSNVYLGNSNDVTFDGHLIKISPIKKINSIFFNYVLRTSKLRKQLVVRGKTTTMTTIGQADIATVNVSLSSIEEQQKIADFLTCIDTKIEQLTKKKKLLEGYKKGVMQNIFSQELRFKDDKGVNYPDWEVKKLGDVGENIIGLTYSPKDIDDSGVIVLRSSNIKDDNINLDDLVKVNTKINDKLLIQKSDIVICTRNGSQRLIGKNIIIKNTDIPMTFGAFMSVFRSSQNEFIYHLFKTHSYYEQVQANLGARINQITNKNINAFKFSFPCLEEQTKIAKFLTAIDEKINLVEKQLNGTKDYKKGLLQQMFI